LVPAIAGAVRAAKDAQVTAEITNLETALNDFKSKFGDFPPSRIILNSNGSYNPGDTTQINGTNDITRGDLEARTARSMRKIFPRAANYFSTGGAGAALPWDLSGNNSPYVILQGHECLVFFLGGMPQALPSGFGMTGFSKNPANPFDAGVNRTVPLFEFAPGRLQDVFNTKGNGPSAQNGFPSYVDPVSSSNEPHTYAYFSSYGNNGYDPNDDNSAFNGDSNLGMKETDDTGGAIFRSFQVAFPIGGTASRIATSGAPNPYTAGNPLPGTTGLAYQKPQSFQIISAGRDGQWGYGGGYDSNSTSTKLPIYSGEPAAAAGIRQRENDNVANFAGGKLQ
jgi:general secretion pathway protein G